MIKSIIGAVAGAKLTQNTKVNNGTGAILGSVAPALIARISLPALIAIGAGGYLLKRHRSQQAGKGTDTLSATSSNRIPAA